MKATDLIVDDIVSLFDEDGCVVPTKIKEIWDETVIASIDNDDVYDELDYEGIMPIPLTGDILAKNGFAWDGTRMQWELEVNDEVITINFGRKIDEEADNYLFVWIANIAKPIHYVHELQHALRLVGLDKLADNFII